MSAEGFFERWSRLKKIAETASTAEIPDAEALLANLTSESDFGQFMRQEISEEIRRKAMKTLFADPHFNVMDGLDIYIDDYSLSDPIPAEMLATLNQMRALSEPAPEEAPPLVDLPAPPEEVGNCDNLTADGQNVPLAPPADRSGEGD